jgi:hypothetical protein
MSVPRHWLATERHGLLILEPTRLLTEAAAEEYRRMGWRVEGPFVPEVAGRWHHSGECPDTGGACPPMGHPAEPTLDDFAAEVVRLEARLQGAVDALRSLVPLLTRGGVLIGGPDAREIRRIVGEALAAVDGGQSPRTCG